ncbi:MAG TPA: proton-conducting transporter membrane subunit [Candidatus Dormibacteraeota bacterium]|jgi:NADH:ubiquinone oxidoreductase subunit 5 (subunit L)/multisubunit Na+/H+ antiporter MnhA subunit
MVIAPLTAFIVALTSVRTRRSSASLAMFGVVVTMVLTLLVGWGLVKTQTPFLHAYQYINMPVAFSGPVNFTSFAVDIVLRVDHITVAALVAIELCMIGVLGWHQVMGRSEPGPARFHALVSLLLFACVGALVSWDLAELVAFWGLAGAVTYLLLAHRWGNDEAAIRARLALALPFATDLSFLCGVAWLYSRYGVQSLTALVPILHTNPGWTVRSLVVASILLFIGVAGRLALWPLHSWLTQTAVTSPPAALALAQTVWSVVAIVVLYRLMPIFVASNPETVRACLYACGVTAVGAPLLALAGNEPRRIVTLLGAGATAVGAAIVIHGFQVPYATFAIAGIACVLAIAPARAAGVLVASAIGAAMRTDNLAEMGEAWARMRLSATALLLAALVLALGASGALVFGVSSRSNLGLALGEAVLLLSIGGVRLFLAVALGPLRRRRTFEPDRVREAPRPSLTWVYWLGAGGAAFLVAALVRGWLDLLDGSKHPMPPAGAYVLWLVVALIGFATVAIAYFGNKESALRASGLAGAWLARLGLAGSRSFTRFIVAPATEIAIRIGDRWIPMGDAGLGSALETTGRFAVMGARLPVVPIVVGLAVVLTLVVGLASPGLFK